MFAYLCDGLLCGEAALPAFAWDTIARRGNLKAGVTRLFLTVMRFPILAAWAALAFSAPVLAQDDTVDWLNNYPEALKEAKRTGKPIFLEYRCEP